MEPRDLEAVVDRLENHLDSPIDPTYPLRDREIVGIWRKRSVAALHTLGTKGLLEQLDTLGHSMFESLLAIAEGPIWPSFEDNPGRTLLLGELIRNIVQPGRITQGLKGTCAATCVEVYMAEHGPAEYARLIAGLITPDGKVMMRSGENLIRDEDVLSPNVGEYRRSPISRIFQVACMEFAYPELDYDNMIDGQLEGATNTGTGLDIRAFERLLRAITGKEWKTLSDAHTQMAEFFAKLGMDTSSVADLHRDALSIIEQSAQRGEDVFATLELPVARNPLRRAGSTRIEHAAHKVRVLGVDRQAGLVHYDDPMDPQQSWFEGIRTRIEDKYGHCSMPIEDFDKLLVELSYRPDLWQKSSTKEESVAPPGIAEGRGPTNGTEPIPATLRGA